jgi:hypothetical protein
MRNDECGTSPPPIPHSSFRIQHSRKRLRQQTRRELRDAGLGCGEARLQPVGVGEDGLDAADDFAFPICGILTP